MELKLFGFIEEVLEELERRRPELEEKAKELEIFFEETLDRIDNGFLNMNARVKSSKSLKEKIIRNQYYQKYSTKEALFENVPDIIGVRIECRFIQDEADLYKFIKRYFNERCKAYPTLYYNAHYPNVLLNLTAKQPQEQKNGMKIYRIDGKCLGTEEPINFEIQIKSLVNVFWGEIEHKVIYKNFNYVIADKFYKDIMKSIKNSLTTIDQQLLLVSNQFDQGKQNSEETQEKQMEKIIAKLVYDIFAIRMKETIGVLVDFKKSCEAIVRYVFRDSLQSGMLESKEVLLVGFEKVKNIDQQEIDFTQKLEFDEVPIYPDTYTQMIGEHIVERINEEFQWNLFFRILFAIEPENNRGDFENFLVYYTQKLYSRMVITKLAGNFTQEETAKITKEIISKFAQCFKRINSVELFYDSMIDQVMKNINIIIDGIYKNVLTFEQWERERRVYLELLEARLLMVFNIEMDGNQVLAILDGIRSTKSNLEVPKGMIKYIYKLS